MNILLCLGESYAAPATVTLKSLALAHAKTPISVYVFFTELSENLRAKICSSLSETTLKINFLKVSSQIFQDLNLKRMDGGFDCYLRLLAANLLPESVEKVIYLDCDLLVLDHLRELWNFEITPFYVGAVPDAVFPARHFVFQEGSELLQHFCDPYFNSGVMVLNLLKWRADHLWEKISEIAQRYQQNLQFHDQDLLNLAVGERWGKIHWRWNIQTADLYREQALANSTLAQEYFQVLTNPGVIHFTRSGAIPGGKPWDNGCIHPYRFIFKEILKTSEFRDWSRVQELSKFDWIQRMRHWGVSWLKQRVWTRRGFRQVVHGKWHLTQFLLTES
jgi:lipopolysaccharide biosynthesis glycosyltransferase